MQSYQLRTFPSSYGQAVLFRRFRPICSQISEKLLVCFLFFNFRHILLTESSIDAYAGSSFPGLADAMAEINLGNDVDEQWKIVRKHFSVILYTIQSASTTLMDVSDFMYTY